jgi:hypothetical protein
MKRPTFLTIWLNVMLLFSIALTVDSLTYLPMIRLTKNYVSLIGIVAGFVQIWAVVQLLRWRKIGVWLLLSSAIVIMFVTAINEFYLISNVGQILVSMLMVLVVNIVMFGILYLAIRPVWKNFK